jgi:AmmeMemoRadiSam system protein B
VVPVDHTLIEALKARESLIHHFPEAYDKEHALEIQLPFLQAVMPGFKVVPLIMGEQDMAVCRRLGEALADTIQGASDVDLASAPVASDHDFVKAHAVHVYIE